MIGGGDIDVARGAIREGVAAIHNLGQLLRSPRVGPRPLARAIPEVREGCEALRGALDDLRTALGARLGAETDLAQLAGAALDLAARRVEGLALALEGNEKRPVEARRRLAVEGEVRKVAGDLDTVLWLVDLLAAVASPRPVQVDLAEVLRNRWSPVPAASSVPVRVDVGADASFSGDPRVAPLLIELAVAVLARDVRESGARLRAERRDDGRLVVRVTREVAATPAPAVKAPRGGGKAPPAPKPPPGLVLPVPLRASLPAVLDAASAAARLLGLELVANAAAGEVTITL